jgi:hypothetical protein
MGLWSAKTYYDSRFFVGKDLWHRSLEVAKLLCLATAVWSIQTAEVMSHPSDYPDMFHYCAGVVAATTVIQIRYVEVMWCQWMGRPGLHPEAFWVARRDFLWTGVQLIFYLAATAYSAVQYFGSHAEGSYNSGGVMDDAKHNSTLESITDDHARDLAAATTETSVAIASEDDVPVILCLLGCLLGQLVLAIIVVFVLSSQFRKIPIQRYFEHLTVSKIRRI